MRWRLGLVLGLSISCPVVAQEANLWTKLPHDLPNDVRSFMERRGQCNYWVGEQDPNDDSEKKAEILAATRKLRCATLEEDEKILKKRFANNTAAQKAINESVLWIFN